MAHRSKRAENASHRYVNLRIKVTRGSEPLKLFDYLFDPKKQLEPQRNELLETGSIQNLIICRTVPGYTVQELARNFRQIARLNSKVVKVVAHYSVSLPVGDNARVDRAAMYRISRALLERLGHERCPYFGVEHHDTSHRHWHLAASTVSYSGEWVSSSFDRYQLRRIERELETDFKLEVVQPRAAVEVKNLSTGEYRLKRRSKKLLPKEKLWLALDECIAASRSLARLIMELRVNYPEISIRLTKRHGEHVGISFEVDGIAFAGRSLGRAYSLNGLMRYHNIQHDNKSKALLDEILTLTHHECKTLYDDMEREQPAQAIASKIHTNSNQLLI